MNRTSEDIAHLAGASAVRVLIVEDEADLALLIGYNLEARAMLSRACRAAMRPS
jgi:hypothetical protein